MREYKGVVFFDVDGTLIDCFNGICKPTEKTKEAIRVLKEEGYLTMLATGRPKCSVNQDILDLGLHGYIASNGSYADLEDEVIFNYPIEKEKLEEVIKYLKEDDKDYMLEGQDYNYLSSDKNKELNDILKKVNISEDKITSKWDINDIECNKIIVMNSCDNHYENTYSKYSDKGFAFMRHPKGTMYEIYVSKYTKGYGVEELISKLGIDKENTYAFGDGENDIEMFQAVKHGIAMGGYHENLKEHAFDFTDDVENEGIYNGLKKLNLIK